MKTVMIVTSAAVLAATAAASSAYAEELTAKEQLGKSIFFDNNLSINFKSVLCFLSRSGVGLDRKRFGYQCGGFGLRRLDCGSIR